MPPHHDDALARHDYLALPQALEHTSWNVQAPSEQEHYAWQPEQFTEASALRLPSPAARATACSGPSASIPPTRSMPARKWRMIYPPQFGAAASPRPLAPACWNGGRGHIGRPRIQATVLPEKARSIPALERVSFQREGLLRSYRKARVPSRDF
ncbi:GNAT family protein [Chromobacterium vaccinii]